MRIGAFILYTGQSTLGDAIISIRKQVNYLRVIEKVKPVNKAINLCFEMAEIEKLDHFLVFGADTIQRDDTIKTYKKYIDDEMWSVLGRLEDYYRKSGEYVNHFYNAKVMKGVRINEKDPMYDHDLHKTMEEKGFKKVITKEITARHHPVWTSKEAFEKHLHSGKRYSDKYIKKYIEQVLERFLRTPNQVNFASLVGFAKGITLKGKSDKQVLSYDDDTCWKWYKVLFDNDNEFKW